MRQSTIEELCKDLGAEIEFRPLSVHETMIKIAKKVKELRPNFHPSIFVDMKDKVCYEWYQTNWSATITVCKRIEPENPADDWEDDWEERTFEVHTGFNGTRDLDSGDLSPDGVPSQWYKIGKLGGKDYDRRGMVGLGMGGHGSYTDMGGQDENGEDKAGQEFRRQIGLRILGMQNRLEAQCRTSRQS